MNTTIESMSLLFNDLLREMNCAYPKENPTLATYAWSVSLTVGGYGNHTIHVCLVNCGDDYRGCPGAYVEITEAHIQNESLTGIIVTRMKRLARDHARIRANWVDKSI